jgi:hypothetical protein
MDINDVKTNPIKIINIEPIMILFSFSGKFADNIISKRLKKEIINIIYRPGRWNLAFEKILTNKNKIIIAKKIPLIRLPVFKIANSLNSIFWFV